jgi:hypothetical protein
MDIDPRSPGVVSHSDRRLRQRNRVDYQIFRSDDTQALERKLGILSQLTFLNYSHQIEY